ncbi:MAG: hypothetical protein ABSF54_13730 [Bryobacteraceae bacterium]
MGAFWADAENLFETARLADQSGAADCDWAILIGAQGEIRMLDAAGWALPSLLAHHGAETAYRVTRQGGRVCLEGRHRSQTCLLQSESPAATARCLLGGGHPAARNSTGPVLLTPAGAAPPAEGLWKMSA